MQFSPEDPREDVSTPLCQAKDTDSAVTDFTRVLIDSLVSVCTYAKSFYFPPEGNRRGFVVAFPDKEGHIRLHLLTRMFMLVIVSSFSAQFSPEDNREDVPTPLCQAKDKFR